ncbi:diguanylate cyclase [Pelomonas sp. KK5]|uniref:GGDEF domain-containing protein n=1 Tax=Pelomonas sp. KK5 TaxID=1855730 RepID=UPI00097C761D|nr:GGDEF domain-containing protein [Pelomonas sp. KK5]
MDSLDASTLLLVNIVFNLFAAAGWAMLAGLFRMAPRASWLMVATHLFRVLQIGCDDLLPRQPEIVVATFEQGCALASLLLLALSLRRLLRLDTGARDIALLAAVGFAGLVMLCLMGQRIGIPMLVSALLVLLALGAARDIVTGAGPGLAGWVTGLLVLPYLLMAGLGVTRLLLLLPGSPQLALALAHGPAVGPVISSLWLLLSISISVSLMALLVWRLVGRIEHLTRRDPMTNTLNRRAIAEAMQRLQALRARGHRFALILMDVDHFKRINDQFGHAAGDAALLHLVTVVRRGLRELDQLGRLGGEEFCALLPHTTLDAAAQVAERIRAALQAEPLLWQERRIEMTASFGVAAGQDEDPQGEAALARADEQVYRAKGEGRNRVCIARETFG